MARQRAPEIDLTALETELDGLGRMPKIPELATFVTAKVKELLPPRDALAMTTLILSIDDDRETRADKCHDAHLVIDQMCHERRFSQNTADALKLIANKVEQVAVSWDHLGDDWACE